MRDADILLTLAEQHAADLQAEARDAAFAAAAQAAGTPGPSSARRPRWLSALARWWAARRRRPYQRRFAS
jgi:hypothetical protein